MEWVEGFERFNAPFQNLRFNANQKSFGNFYLLPCFTKALHRSFYGRRSHTVHNDLYSAYRADVRTRVTCRGIYPSGTLYFHSAEHLHHLKIRALDGLAVRRGQGLQLSLLQETVSQGSALRARQ